MQFGCQCLFVHVELFSFVFNEDISFLPKKDIDGSEFEVKIQARKGYGPFEMITLK